MTILVNLFQVTLRAIVRIFRSSILSYLFLVRYFASNVEEHDTNCQWWPNETKIKPHRQVALSAMSRLDCAGRAVRCTLMKEHCSIVL